MHSGRDRGRICRGPSRPQLTWAGVMTLLRFASNPCRNRDEVVLLASSYPRRPASPAPLALGANGASTSAPIQHQGPAQRVRISVPRIHAYFTGTGDLMTALLLGYLHRHPGDLRLAVERAVNACQVVLKGTVQAGGPAALIDSRAAAVCKSVPVPAKLPPSPSSSDLPVPVSAGPGSFG